MKIRPVGAELFYVDGQTDRQDEDNNLSFLVILRDAPKNCIYEFAQFTARSNFTRRSAHSGLYARSTKHRGRFCARPVLSTPADRNGS